jgi:hypothetical protein
LASKTIASWKCCLCTQRFMERRSISK